MDKDFDAKRFADAVEAREKLLKGQLEEAYCALLARVRGQEFINSHLTIQVEGLEELTDNLRANEHELTKQLDFVAGCLAQSEKCFMPKEFSCSYRTPYGLYCHAEKAIRLNCIYLRAEEAAKQADMEVEDAEDAD